MGRRVCISLKRVVSGNVRRLRKLKKLTQEQLADLIGVATMTISRIERGKEWASDIILERLAKVFGLPYVYLFCSAEDFRDLIYLSMDSFKDLMGETFESKVGDIN